MPVQHRLCLSLGCQSQQHLLFPSKGGRRQPGWGGSKLSSAVATPGPTLTPSSPHYTIKNWGKIKPVCSGSSTGALSEAPNTSTAQKGLFPTSCSPTWIL